LGTKIKAAVAEKKIGCRINIETEVLISKSKALNFHSFNVAREYCLAQRATTVAIARLL